MPPGARVTTPALPSVRTLAAIFALPAVALAIAVLASVLADIPMDVIARDPLATVDAHPLTGIQSVLGVAILWAAASVLLFTWVVLRKSERGSQISSFVLWSGLLTALLAIDDQLQFHDDLIGRYLGGRERFALLGALALILVYLYRFRREILRTEWMLLGLALVLMAASVGVDVVSGTPAVGPDGHWTDESNVFLFFEDGLKLLGIAAWAGYFLRVAFGALLPDASAPADSP